jgi:hypothetical protein
MARKHDGLVSASGSCENRLKQIWQFREEYIMSRKLKTKTTIELSTKELIRALEKGTFVDRKIKNVEWVYKTKWYDDGRGGETETVVTGAVLIMAGA